MADVQAQLKDLLTFLTRDAKIPLATSISKCKALRDNGLISPDAIAKSGANALGPIFNDPKVVKQVLAAAKRVSNPKKRSLSTTGALESPFKQPKLAPENEARLELPATDVSIEQICDKVIETNRAPLFMAFALIVSGYVLHDQPLSSRLSLAQAVTSAGAQSKAKYIGLIDSTPEDDGMSEGQPKIRLMGREIAVMRRHIAVGVKEEPDDSQTTVNNESSGGSHEAFWGLDLEALRKPNASIQFGKSVTGLPIHKPEAARAYLLKSIKLVDTDSVQETRPLIKEEDSSESKKTKKTTSAEQSARRDQAVALLLRAIDHVCASWADTLSNDDLDRRANSWYAKVRPDVQEGQAGWGQRGRLPLRDIIHLANVS